MYTARLSTMLESNDLIQEQAYLVSRGVRPLALLSAIPLDESKMRDEFVRLNQLAGQYAVIPFVLPRKDMKCAEAGFAAAPWVIELLAWSYEQPLRQRHQIVGLLLGYSPESIGAHDAREFAGNPIGSSMSR